MKRIFLMLGSTLVAASMLGCIGDRGMRSGFPGGAGGYQTPSGAYPGATPSGGG